MPISEPSPRISALVRAALFVGDLDQSIRFYRDVIGLQVCYARGQARNEAFAALIGRPPQSAIRYEILQAPGPSRGMVGLFEVREPDPEALHRPTQGCARGEVCLVFYCDDLDGLERRLDDWGSAFVCRPRFLSVRPDRGQREMTFRDPDGVMVNVIERAPDAD